MMTSATLFPLPEKAAAEPQDPSGRPRLKTAERRQMLLQPLCLDELLEEEHLARAVWAYVGKLDLSFLYAAIKAVEGHSGRPATDPKLLLALWVYATLDGVGSARALAELCERHAAYQWLCGGVGVNYHTLADFRVLEPEQLDELLAQSVAVLKAAGVTDLSRAAQDGVRVRANAGAASFHRQATLERHLAEARAEVQRLKQELEADPAATKDRRRAARERAAREREERLVEALRQLPEVAARKPKGEREAARVSATDPDARVMKMADGGFRPAYNIQFAADTKSQAVTGVEVGNVGSDMGQLAPMVAKVEQQQGQAPAEWLVDGGYVKKEDLAAVAPPHGATKVYAPVPKPKKEEVDPHQPRPKDVPAVAEWRTRMGTAEAKEIYKERAATSECVNAQARNRGLVQLLVRGTRKVLSVALVYGLAHNVLRAISLGVCGSGGP